MTETMASGGPFATPDLPRGRLVDNIMQFARTLRAAGLRVGPGDVIDAVRAVEAVGVERRDDFYWALFAVFIKRRQDKDVFDHAFHIFWKDPELLRRMMSLLLPRLNVPGADAPEMSRRLREALAADALSDAAEDAGEREREQVEIEVELNWSDQEKLGSMDFEQMSVEEFEQAKRLVARMRLPVNEVTTRRQRAHARGPRVDMRATLRGSLRTGGAFIPLRRRAPVRRPPPLVVLCDISGSMERYSRIFLHFMHALANSRDRFQAFVFGTRLSNITRQLAHKDPDVALSEAGGAVEDWSGGTRIGRCLREFNRHWSRRVLAQGAVVVLMTDGLDQAAAEGLEREIERLHKSCRRLIWLNPLLRWDGFQPRAAGIRAILPHVDDFRPVHNLDSLADLIAALSGGPSGPTAPRREERVSPLARAAV
jgi:uncharacterized protein with von Willebrand factor type A (vWA) domain